MAKAYWIAAYRSISKPEEMSPFVEVATKAIEAAGGRFLVRGGGRVVAFEDGVPERTVLVEFDDFESAIAAFHSDEYQFALKMLGDGSVVRDTRMVEGVD